MCVWCACIMYTHTFTNGYLVVCLGFNALHCARMSPQDQAEEQDTRKEIPHVKRVWNWLVLCEDSECNGIFLKEFVSAISLLLSRFRDCNIHSRRSLPFQ